jgi:hypothetical protein
MFAAADDSDELLFAQHSSWWYSCGVDVVPGVEIRRFAGGIRADGDTPVAALANAKTMLGAPRRTDA